MNYEHLIKEVQKSNMSNDVKNDIIEYLKENMW